MDNNNENNKSNNTNTQKKNNNNNLNSKITKSFNFTNQKKKIFFFQIQNKVIL